MLNEIWELINTISAKYESYSDFNLVEIIKDYNNDNDSTYKVEDIKDFFIKWNDIHLIMTDNTEIECNWTEPDTDMKRPDDILFNTFDYE